MSSPYFKPGSTWSDRLAEVSEALSNFEAANRDVILRCLKQDQLRVVVNLPADALLGVLGGDHYRNCYELPFIAGAVRVPSQKRIRVDSLLGFVPDGRNRYFAAISFGGTGVRFYGEYCLAIKPSVLNGPAILDRNSYELLDPPLSEEENPSAIVGVLRGSWNDLPAVLTLKVLASVRQENRLLPPGAISDAVLRDEDFVEVHLADKIVTASIDEIRQAPEDVARDSHLRQQLAKRNMPRPEELLWSKQRHEVDIQLGQAGVKNRIITTNGRGARWK
jgi:hypothetical protein